MTQVTWRGTIACGPTIDPINGGDTMKATQLLHNLGQSLWLDNITRDLLDSGTLQRYIDELSVTGLTSNPTIFDHAIKGSTAYDAASVTSLQKGKAGRSCSSIWRSSDHHAGRRPVPADLSTGPTPSTAGSRWKSRRCSPTTRRARWLPPRTSMRGRRVPTCLSRFPAPRKVCLRSKRRSSPESPSM